MSRALVLGGGGGVGAAWATGLVAGLARHGVDLSTAELVVGTSAGAVVGARLTSGLPVVDLAELEHDAPPSGRSAAPARMTRRSMLRWQVAAMLPGTVQRKRARVGRAALRAGTQPVQERLDHIARQLPEHDGPRTSGWHWSRSTRGPVRTWCSPGRPGRRWSGRSRRAAPCRC